MWFGDYIKVELVRYTPEPVDTAGRAAGICWDKEEKEDYGTFVKRIVKKGHESVIEHVSFTFRIEGVSRALTHQLVRHRIASYSQRSQRYVDEGEFEYVTPPNVESDEKARKLFVDFMEESKELYHRLRGMGIRKQDARFVLPNACETRIFVTMNARSLRNFFHLRMARGAQWEIRKLATKMFDLVHDVAPELFEDLKEAADLARKD
ncbi:MAG: FAD-dependent thymidylate synthase [Thermoplasmata archaeon]|nr:FAD-dependent thymidylate synthase [Thermoplasmata archaeon]